MTVGPGQCDDMVQYAVSRGTDEPPAGIVSWQYMKSRPESGLMYPGAAKLRGISWSTNQAGSPDASYGGVLHTAASAAQVYAFYEDWLFAHGWVLYRDRPRGGATVWLSNRGYVRHPREMFGVAIDNPQLLRNTLGGVSPVEGTVFEYCYSIFLPGHGPQLA